jgi:F0F1-type ATP synthase assembly protein I
MVDSSSGEQSQADAERAESESRHRSQQSSAGGGEQPHLSSSLKGDATMWRFAGAGMELGGSAILFAAIGYAVDRYLENTTLVATALGAVLGFAGGLYRFIRMAMAVNQPTGRQPRNPQ